MAKRKTVRKSARKAKSVAKAETIQVTLDAPVAAKVDVLVVGAGIAGCLAAVASARNGADTMLVDRYGQIGGNMGPGIFCGGVLHLALTNADAMHEGLRGLAGEFLNRCGAFVDGQLGKEYFQDSQVVTYVWQQMMKENNVRLLLNAAASQPIMDGTRAVGLVVETPSGPCAIRAKVIIDATGDANVAARCGAQTDEATAGFHPGVLLTMAGVDVPKYLDAMAQLGDPSEELTKWVEDKYDQMGVRMKAFRRQPMVAILKRGWDLGEYRFLRRVGHGATVSMDHGIFVRNRGAYGCPDDRGGMVGAMACLCGKGVPWSDPLVHTELEVGVRNYCFETAQFFRHHVPGFEHSNLHMISPYFHNRVGRSAVCDYGITAEDTQTGATFKDAVFHTWGTERRDCDPKGYDWPYRAFLPKGVEGLLVTGRSACIGPTVNRTRYKMLLMGQAAGVAAALAATSNVTPRNVDLPALQRILTTKYHVPTEEDAG